MKNMSLYLNFGLANLDSINTYSYTNKPQQKVTAITAWQQ